MAVPKRRNTRAKRKMRRANHDRVTAPNLTACPSCGDIMVPHRMCASCGKYAGRVIEIIAGKSES